MHDDDAQFLLDEYLSALHAGRAPDRAALLARRPDLAAALDCLEMLDRLAPPATAPEPAPSDAATLPGRSLTMSGERVGKYVIERELGRGGMGVVYLARDTEMNRLVALKMILAGSMAGEEYLRRFQAEVRASAQLDHEGIVRVYDSGEFNGLPYLAMQYIAGPTLSEYLRRYRTDLDLAVRCAIRLARTVAYLHAHQVVHRDLKPANVLLQLAPGSPGDAREFPPASRGLYDVKISDFGLAKMLAEDSGATRSGAIMGTPSYMAPEQARGESRSVGPAADVYALGAILYELLTHRPPFVGETSMATLMQVMGSEPISPRRLNPAIHRDLEAVCLKCLEKSPEARFASAAEVADALERHLKGEDVPSARPTPRQMAERWVRRNPALASRLAILVTCALVLLGNTVLGGSRIYSKSFGALKLEHLGLVFAGWLGMSWLFQRLVRRQRGLEIVPYVWAAFDVGILTITLLLTDSLVSPIDIGYPLLIAASGLWLRERLVWFTSACCNLGYFGATLILLSVSHREQVHRHVIFLAGMVTLTFLILHQVRRFTALSRYYEGK